MPLARDQLTIAGGMRIPSRVRKWSSLAPPELRAAVQSEEVVRIQLIDSHEDALLEEWRGEDGALVIPLREESLPDGDYRVRLLLGESLAPTQELNLRLRSADTPDPGWGAAARLVYHLATPIGAITAGESNDGNLDAVLVDGAYAEGDHGTEVRNVARGSVPWQPVKQATPAASPIQVGVPDAKSCVVTGAHYLEFPTYHGETAALHRGRLQVLRPGQEIPRLGAAQMEVGWRGRLANDGPGERIGRRASAGE